MKKSFSVPSLSFDVILDVDAELQPPPPADDAVVLSASRFKSLMTAGSTFMAERRYFHAMNWACERQYRFGLLAKSREHVYVGR